MITAVAPNADLRQHYDEHGVVHVADLIDPSEVDGIRTSFMAQVHEDRSAVGFDDNVPADDVLARFPRFVHPHRRPDLAVGRLARRYMLDRRIVDRVEAMVGAPVHGAQSMFYFKPPGARGQALHQDNTALHAHPETCIAVWIAVDPVDDYNGGLRLVPGSHRYALVCPSDEADQATSFSKNTLVLPDGLTTQPSQMRPGDALFFHGNIVHGSGPNHSADRFRRSLIFHYVPQASVAIARFYLPLVGPDGKDVLIVGSNEGGVCGEAWVTDKGHLFHRNDIEEALEHGGTQSFDEAIGFLILRTDNPDNNGLQANLLT
ncbi:phytanoyl-dioxygenase family protein [Grosmannia clavigera kw1407]|uniref:Phytanoyl-dioxygenase family protein n=1 Tax=Grosmannia clavigera (strain kw1407 / UAMH 11150) TaxID=655863 RepID=F0XEW2_GROCL|nr:phytanoyl-dioxygenase family protein [Grosmannia clavigera kw1407]EFX03760.1 phytanoyl-dioxygenase family protein [Grosmannia clavigera kw1407]